MNQPITFFVQGKPQTAGSKRAFVLKKGGAYTGRAIVVDDNPKGRDWKIDVQHAAKEAMQKRGRQPFLGPVRLTLTFFLKRPQHHYGTGKNANTVKLSAPAFPCGKPDVLKLARAVEDGMSGVVYSDDCLIVSETIKKRYGGIEGVAVDIYEEYP